MRKIELNRLEGTRKKQRINISYDENITQHDRENKIGENDQYILTDDIEVLKLVKLSSKSDIDNIDKESDERYHIDMIDDKDSDERYQIGERQAN